MPQEFKLPDLGEGIKAGDVVAVHVAEGDTIKPDQTVVEIETDKAVLEVPSPMGGKVTKVHIRQGQKVAIGATLLTIDPAQNGQAAAPAAKAESKPAAPAPAPEAKAPPAPEAKSAPAPAAPPKAPEKPAPAREQRPAPTAANEPIPAGPATRRLARELGVDLQQVASSFSNERLTEDHVKQFVKSLMQSGGPSSGGAPGVRVPPLPDFSKFGEIDSQPLTSLNRKTAENIHAAWSIIPHVTQFDEADVSSLEDVRKKFKEHGDAKIKLTVTAFAIKAAVAALKAFPKFNTSLDLNAGQLVYKKYYHIGVAVDTEAGLIVPVIRDADKKGVLDIAKELADVSERTRNRKVGLDELRGGCFTITNLGGIGGTNFTPIVNYPEVAILGMARTREVPTIQNGALTTRMVLPLSLSYDHRVINGADGARFLRKLATYLESPALLLLQG